MTKKKSSKFVPGKTYIPVSGKVFDREEIDNAIQAAKDGWWTEGRFGKQFERKFAKYLGAKFVSLVNSGSSANLVAVAALTSKAFGSKRLKPGDEYITTATGFPTTVNPGIMHGLKSVFVDADLDTLNANPDQIEKAITKKTKLIMLAHTLGKPFDLDRIMKLVKKHDLWLIEDCCDALGSTYRDKLVSSFGHIATFSFYPAHQITMGEGGAVVTNHPLVHRAVRQFRDWGRDCWCDPGRDNTCGRRFDWQLGELPKGYDHKYIYSQIGYNLKLTDFQPAIGLAQLKKLPKFIKARRENYQKYHQFFSQYPDYFTLMRTTAKENPSWFGFPVVVRKSAPFTRNQLTKYLEEHQIGTRNVFAGNLLRHPGYLDLKCRRISSLTNADAIMNRAFWIGVYPGIKSAQQQYVINTLQLFFALFLKKSKQP